MKIAITGTSCGIGLAIKQLLENDHDLVCLDITDGYDIGDLSIIKHILDADVFINNAYCKTKPEAQQQLFEAVQEEWQYTKKHIINMGSLSKYYDPVELTFPEYTIAKKELNASHCEALIKGRNNILTQICPGYTDTALIESFDVPKMDVNVVSLAVKHCIEMAQAGVEVADYTVAKTKNIKGD